MPVPPKPALAARVPQTAFAVWCHDGPGGGALRRQHLDGHLAYIEAHFDRYLVAGPLREEGRHDIIGSIFVILADTEAEARAFLNGDPYVRSGLYETSIYRVITPAAGRWLGGVIWESADSLRSLADGGN